MRTSGKNAPGDESPWYEEGLRFECTRCGDCCGGAPGVVWVDDQEIEALARRLELTQEEFCERYTRRVDGGVSLTEKPDWDCVFYKKGRGCMVYEDRPLQCRTWPFWGKNVESPIAWDNAARHCPGMNQGRLWDLIEIQVRVRDDGLHGEDDSKEDD